MALILKGLFHCVTCARAFRNLPSGSVRDASSMMHSLPSPTKHIVDAVAGFYIRAWETKTDALLLTVVKMDLARRSVEGTVDFDRQHVAIRVFLDADPRRAHSILEVQTRIDHGIPLLARFYPRAEHRELARVIEIVSLIVRNVFPRIADEPEEAKRELFISEISLAVVAYITSALGPCFWMPRFLTLSARLAVKPSASGTKSRSIKENISPSYSPLRFQGRPV
jgi:hypothetical protein